MVVANYFVAASFLPLGGRNAEIGVAVANPSGYLLLFELPA
jgi:hypothetical protein